MTNLREATVVSLLASRTHNVVVNHLARLPKRERVEIVSMDMWAPYREASRAALPQARIVVDKFHVVRMANQAVEVVRKTLRAELSDKQRRALMRDRFALLKRADALTDRDRLTLDLWTA
jgi:transposase